MDDKLLKEMAKLITVNCVRNTIIERYHARGSLSDEDMKAFNIEVCNKIYAALYIWENGTNQELGELLWLWGTAGRADHWDEPQIDEDTAGAMKLVRTNFPEVSKKIAQVYKSKRSSKKT